MNNDLHITSWTITAKDGEIEAVAWLSNGTKLSKKIFYYYDDIEKLYALVPLLSAVTEVVLGTVESMNGGAK